MVNSDRDIILKTSSDTEALNGRILIYKGGTNAYFIRSDFWESFKSYTTLLSKSVDLTYTPTEKLCMTIIPTYGKYVALLVQLLAKKLGYIMSLDSLFNLLAYEQKYLYEILDDLKSEMKANEKYAIILKEINTLTSSLEQKNQELTCLKEEIQELRRTLDNKAYQMRRTPKWSEPDVMPVLTKYPLLSQQMVEDVEVETMLIDQHINININKGMSETNKAFLANYYYIVLEFVAVKMPHLITLIRKFTTDRG